MWICLPDAFISVVQDRLCPDLLWVRGRRGAHLEALFGGREITSTPARDYGYRLGVSRAEAAEVLVKRIAALDYTNFKDSVRDPNLHDLYLRFWHDHWLYQRAEQSGVTLG